MSYTLGLTPAGSAYGDTFPCPGSDAVQLTVMNAAVEVELGDGHPVSPTWRPPSFRLPGVHTIPGPIDCLRVRAAAPIDPARPPRYTIDAY